MVSSDKGRIAISINKELIQDLDYLEKKYNIKKSKLVQTLLEKYLVHEFGNIERNDSDE